MNSFKIKKDKIQLLVKKYAREKLGYQDILVVPKDFLEETIGGGRIIMSKKLQKCDVVFAFVHSGTKLVDKKFSDQIKIANTTKTAKLIFDNYDLGTPYIASKLLKYTKIIKRSAFIYYDLTRVVGDPNRLKRKDQFPDQQFRGESLFSQKTDKNLLGRVYIDKFFDGVLEFLQEKRPKFVYWIHTYDEYGGGKATTIDNSKGKRPVGMIFQKYRFKKEAFGRYKNKNSSADFNLLEDKHIDVIQKIIKDQFRDKIYLKGEKIDFPVDFPYQSPIMLPGLVKFEFPNIFQVTTEYRKDLVAKEKINTVVSSILEITNQILKL